MIVLEGQFTQHWKESQQDDSCRLVSQAHNSMTKVVKYIKKKIGEKCHPSTMLSMGVTHLNYYDE